MFRVPHPYNWVRFLCLGNITSNLSKKGDSCFGGAVWLNGDLSFFLNAALSFSDGAMVVLFV